MAIEVAYAGYDNAIVRELTLADQPLPEADRLAVTRVGLSVDGKSFDSDADPSILSYDSSDGSVKFRAGLAGLRTEEGHLVYITVYDALSVNGLAWDMFTLHVRDWPKGA